MSAFKWFKAEPGKLILDGTPFRIVFDGAATNGFPFIIWRDDMQIHASGDLHTAKMLAEMKASELIELGIIEP